MKKALVTGDLGFIGKHLCHALSASGEYEVFGLDRRRNSDEDVRYCNFPEVDVCFHLAAQIKVSSTDAYEDASTNIMGTIRILEHYREQVVFATSYITSTPVIPYAISKNACEHYCRWYGARMVRICNPVGPGGHGVFEAFAKADILKIAGKGDQVREYIPISRVITAFMDAASAPPGTLISLRGTKLTVLDIADLFYPTKPREFVAQDISDLAVITNDRRDT